MAVVGGFDGPAVGPGVGEVLLGAAVGLLVGEAVVGAADGPVLGGRLGEGESGAAAATSFKQPTVVTAKTVGPGRASAAWVSLNSAV